MDKKEEESKLGDHWREGAPVQMGRPRRRRREQLRLRVLKDV
jgi:hypothetical protein